MQRKQVPTRDSHVSSPFKLDGVVGENGCLGLNQREFQQAS